jgi:hypothetical protein
MYGKQFQFDSHFAAIAVLAPQTASKYTHPVQLPCENSSLSQSFHGDAPEFNSKPSAGNLATKHELAFGPLDLLESIICGGMR